MKKKLPIGIQSFSEIRENNFYYIDKTKLIYTLIEEGKFYFISRPRRFGKSLLLSTLKSLFEGKKELFEGLWIDSSDYSWKEFPVVFLDFSRISASTHEKFIQGLSAQLQEIANAHKIELKNQELEEQWSELIQKLSKKEKVVILIDEYDRPITETLDNPPITEQNRSVIRTLFSIIKSLDSSIRFAFVMGISKTSQLSFFSGGNNLKDISLYERFSNLMGYTQKEIMSYFEEEIKICAEKNGLSYEDILKEMRIWYNGHRFSKEESLVYNPFSTLLFLDTQTFGSYWFSSGTPKLLFNILEKKPEAIGSIDCAQAPLSIFESSPIENTSLIALLWQSGYLTIKGWENLQYKLGFPNKEVEYAFEESLKHHFIEKDLTKLQSFTKQIANHLTKMELPLFWSKMRTFFASIPYDLHEHKSERSYQLMCYLILKSIGMDIKSEVHTNKGRIDLIVQTESIIYIFELKINTSPEKALKQILENEYYAPFLFQEKPLLLQGVSFDTHDEKNLSFSKPLFYNEKGEEISAEKAGYQGRLPF